MRPDEDSNKQKKQEVEPNENGNVESAYADMHEFLAAVILFVPTLSRPQLFALGEIVATRGAVDLLDRVGVNAHVFVNRHQHGDWGVVCASDADVNYRAIVDGNRILSEYKLGGGRERLWIITEHDRSVTTLLLPDEY